MAGDWNGIGRDGIGYQQNGTLHLRNDATRPGSSDYLEYRRDDPDWQSAGHWDGDGEDGFGLVDYLACGAAREVIPRIWMDRREPANKASSVTSEFDFDDPSPYSWAIGVAGDWNGDGVDGVALYLGYDRQIRLHNDLPASGGADYVYPADSAECDSRTLVAGRWQ